MRLLRMQYRFRRDIDTMHGAPALDALPSNLSIAHRSTQMAADLRDLGQKPPRHEPDLALMALSDPSTALGWLYVAEASNRGAVVLLKLAKKLGFDQTFGARHMSAHPSGRASHWRAFVAMLDALDMDEA